MSIPEFIQAITRDFRLLFKYYTKETLATSFMTGFLYFLFPAILIITVGVNLIITFYYIYMMYYVIMFLILMGLVYYGICKGIQTLKNYQEYDVVPYRRIKYIILVPSAIFLMLIAIATAFEITQ